MPSQNACWRPSRAASTRRDGDAERGDRRVRTGAVDTADVFHGDTVDLADLVDEQVDEVGRRQADGQLVDRAAAAALEDVDADDVAVHGADPAGHLAERTRAIGQPHPHDVRLHGGEATQPLLRGWSPPRDGRVNRTADISVAGRGAGRGRRRQLPAARGAGAAARHGRRPGDRRLVRRPRRAAGDGRRAPSRRRADRHPHAADAHRRGRARRPRDPAPTTRGPASSCSASTPARPTPSRSSAGRRRPGSATSSRTASATSQQLAGALRTVATGGSVVDPLVVQELIAARRVLADSPLGALSERELEVLAAMAEGLSNAAIAARTSPPSARWRSTSTRSSPS